MKVNRKDIRDIDNFKKFGDDFKKIWSDDMNHIYVFQRSNDHYPSVNYEVVCGKRETNHDGSVVYTYPRSEHFGVDAFCVCGNMRGFEERIKSYVERFKKRGKK